MDSHGQDLINIDLQIWILAFLYMDTLALRFCTLRNLRCISKAGRVVFLDAPSWKFCGISPLCNFPDYPHVRKFLFGLVHPLVWLEPSYSPGRPNRQFLTYNNRLWEDSRSPPHYCGFEIDLLSSRAQPRRWRAESAPPIPRTFDDLDYYMGVNLSDAFWHGRTWVLTLRNEDSDVRHALESRSQDWVHVDDDRFDGADTFLTRRTLQQIASRSYSGAGMYR